ncbi:hypothetical protein [Streptomyces sp. NL15-2K]|uniref:hypothetical protein n=1 Tax=Streptomyces sp. NL15-2K TaxID=376149 RepID=UPI000F56D029|nr:MULTISPECIES: hypothetical protein [Actinomycetes]WKX07277.1 hypothetical protein Q4V64_07190 [Kutzneria buriramensis]
MGTPPSASVKNVQEVRDVMMGADSSDPQITAGQTVFTLIVKQVSLTIIWCVQAARVVLEAEQNREVIRGGA